MDERNQAPEVEAQALQEHRALALPADKEPVALQQPADGFDRPGQCFLDLTGLVEGDHARRKQAPVLEALEKRKDLRERERRLVQLRAKALAVVIDLLREPELLVAREEPDLGHLVEVKLEQISAARLAALGGAARLGLLVAVLGRPLFAAAGRRSVHRRHLHRPPARAAGRLQRRERQSVRALLRKIFGHRLTLSLDGARGPPLGAQFRQTRCSPVRGGQKKARASFPSLVSARVFKVSLAPFRRVRFRSSSRHPL
jgi:hypothetical protein